MTQNVQYDSDIAKTRMARVRLGERIGDSDDGAPERLRASICRLHAARRPHGLAPAPAPALAPARPGSLRAQGSTHLVP